MHVEHDAAQVGFLEALATLTNVAGGLSDDDLQAASYCRGWTVGDVLAHVHLGLQEMLLGVVSPTDEAPDTDAATYWRTDVPSNDEDADEVSHVRFIRLLAAAYRRPTGLVGHLEPTAEGLTNAVRALQPGAVRFQRRVLTTGDFLATWVVEVAVHHLDLRRELDLPTPPVSALAIVRTTFEALAGGPLPAAWSDETVALLGGGRVALTAEHVVEAGPIAQRLPVLG